MAERPGPDLGAVLRQEAERHVPDGAAMLTRIAQRRAEKPGRWAFTALRPAAAAASVVATLVAGFAGIKLTGDRSGGGDPPAAAAADAVSSAPTTPASRPPVEVTAPAARPGRTTSTPTSLWRPNAGFLRSRAVVDRHSNATWTQGNLTLTTAETVTKLDLVISVARTAGVKDAGRWTSVPTEMITMTVGEDEEMVVYRFTLNDGRTLAPGEYTFAAQYTHASGKRDPGGDTYGAIAWTDEKRAEVTGVFEN